MPWAILIPCILLLGVTAILIRQRFKNSREFTPVKIKVQPAIRATQFNGWVSLELEAANQSNSTIWLEEAKFLISDLHANFQTALPINQKTYPIRQAIPPHESVSLSIGPTLYEAAGSPQGYYSFRFIGNVHYRIGQQTAAVKISRHWIEMAALSVLHFKRVRTTTSEEPAYSDLTLPDREPSSDYVTK
jgi:hypothetical protein